MSWQQIEPFLVALAIGLLLGLERERSHARTLPAGSRSFALLALAGVTAASIDGYAVAIGLAGVAALMVVAYYRASDDDPGTTTVLAGVVAYLLGVLTLDRAALAVALAVIVAVLLVSKERIHRFAREIVSEVEVEDAIKFLVVAFVVLPLLPNRALGPYGVLNPSKVWLLVVLLTGIGWLGYLGVRALGPARGLLITGLAGGFVSATATTASMGRLSRTMSSMRAPLASALLASLATFGQLLIVIAVIDVDVLRQLWLPVITGAAALILVVVVVYRGAGAGPPSDGAGNPAGSDHRSAGPAPAARPFALRPALILAAVLTVALLVGRWGGAVLGPQGTILASLAAGLADAHAGAVAAASLAAQGDVTVDTALIAIGAALGSNVIVKGVLAFTAGGRHFGLRYLAGMAAPSLVFAVALTMVIIG